VKHSATRQLEEYLDNLKPSLILTKSWNLPLSSHKKALGFLKKATTLKKTDSSTLTISIISFCSFGFHNFRFSTLGSGMVKQQIFALS